MKTTNAVKKLEKLGFSNRGDQRSFSFSKDGSNYRIEFFDQTGSVICLGIRRENDHSDSMTDYCATIFADSLSQAIRLCR